MIFWAVASPIPDKVCSWPLLAELMSIRSLLTVFFFPAVLELLAEPPAVEDA